MPAIARKLADNECVLRAAWGDAIPAFTERILKLADRAAEQIDPATGRIMPAGSGVVEWAQGIAPEMLANLASAYRATRAEKHARTARGIYEYWLEIERFDEGYAPAKDPIAIPHRLGDTEVVGWFGALPEFLESAAFDDRFLGRICENARRNLNHLLTILHPGRNMRMTQLDALLTEGLRLDFIPDSAAWRDVGLRGLNDCFYRQFNPDGSSIEATGWYHYIVANMALRYLRLKRAMPELGLQVTEKLVADAFDYTAALIAPNGEFNLVGDCTPAVYPFRTLEEFLRHRAEVRRELGFTAALPPVSQIFHGARQAMLREGWEAGGTYITFDVTRRMGFHWHPAQNAIQVYSGDRRLIADPGRMRYEPTPQRAYAVSTRGHSTINIGGLDQSDSEGEIGLRTAAGYDVVTGNYDGGYWPMRDMEHGEGIYASHHRTLIWIRGACIIVLDNLYHTQGCGHKPAIECNWQFGPGKVALEPDHGRLVGEFDGARLLMLFALKPADMRFAVREGTLDPCWGWAADAGDNPRPAPALNMRVEDYDPWNLHLATVLIPCRGGEVPEARITQSIDPLVKPFGRIAIEWGDGATDLLFWTRRLDSALGIADDIRTDAAMVHVRKNAAGSLVKALVYEGSYLEPWMPAWRPNRGTFVISGNRTQ